MLQHIDERVSPTENDGDEDSDADSDIEIANATGDIAERITDTDDLRAIADGAADDDSRLEILEHPGEWESL